MVPAAAPPAQPPSRLARFRRGSQALPAKVLVTVVDGSPVGAPLAKAPGICQGPPQAWLGTVPPCPKVAAPRIGVYLPWASEFQASLLAARIDVTKKMVVRAPNAHEALCAGAGSEHLVMDAWGLPFKQQAAADCSRISRRWLQQTWPSLAHVYECNESLMDTAFSDSEKPYCCRCVGPCTATLEQPGLATGGCPCTPFSNLRHTKGSTSNTGLAHQRTSFQVINDQLPRYLSGRRPHSFIVEEVVTVTKMDPRTGRPYFTGISQSCAKAGYCIRVMQADHGHWIIIIIIIIINNVIIIIIIILIIQTMMMMIMMMMINSLARNSLASIHWPPYIESMCEKNTKNTKNQRKENKNIMKQTNTKIRTTRT